MIEIESAGLSEIGKKRHANEDRMLVNDALRLYAVADGMGGHKAGEVASQLTVDTLQAHIKKTPKNGSDLWGRREKRLSRSAGQLLAAIQCSNQAVHSASRSNSAYHGMGTTVAAVLFTGDTVIAANVGDSSIHLIRDAEITQLSVEHTLLAEQRAANDEMAESAARGLSHVLTRAIGTHAEVNVDIFELQCFTNDILVICSDGLTGKASPADIRTIVLAEEDPRTACRRLIDLANKRGGDDNITAVVVKVRQVAQRRGINSGWWHAIAEKIKNSAVRRK